MDPFEEQLITLADTITPDKRFASHLEAQLRQPVAVEQKPVLTRSLKWMLNTAAGIILLIALIVTVPPLRTLAQEIIDHLFHRLDSDQTTYTYNSVPPTVMIDQPVVFQAISDAEVQWGLDIVEPTYIPDGYLFEQVNASGYDGLYAAMQSYVQTVDGTLTYLQIMQSNSAFDQNGTDSVGAGAEIKTVELTWGDQKINASYVEGMWQTADTEQQGRVVTENLEWNPDASIRRLRWQYGEQIFQIAVAGGMPETTGYLSLDTISEVAESMYTPAVAAQSTVFTSIDSAATTTGLVIPVPEQIPARYKLKRVYAQPPLQEFRLTYLTNGGQIVITRLPQGLISSLSDEIGSSAKVASVPINWQGAQINAEYVAGAWLMGNKISYKGEVSEFHEWSNTAAVRRLRWNADDFMYEIAVMGLPGEQDFSAPVLAAIAESMQ